MTDRSKMMQQELEAQIHKAGMNPVMQGECYLMHPEALQKLIEVAIREALAKQPAQPSKPWVGLTDVEIASACKKHGGAEWWWRDIEEYGRAIEAKLKEKNT